MTDYPASSLVQTKGKWYVNITIPKELRPHFKNQKQLRRSTGTSDKATAKKKLHGITTELHAALDAARPDPLQGLADILDLEVEEVHELVETEEITDTINRRLYASTPGGDLEEELAVARIQRAGEQAQQEWQRIKISAQRPLPTETHAISEASEQYLASAPYSKQKTAKEAHTALSEFEDFMQGAALQDIKSVDGHKFAEQVGQTKSSKTVAKKLGYVRGMLDYCERTGLIETNPFKALRIRKGLGTPKKSYRPLTAKELEKLFAREMEPSTRLLLSILVASGMRLDEAALLDWSDIKEEGGITYFDLTERDETIKNIGSARKVPVHSALSEAVYVGGGEGPIFPNLPRDADGKAQGPASKVCMREIRCVTMDRTKVTHSLRGNFKDMLRDAGVSKEVNDFLTGHSAGDVAGSYGQGPSLGTRKEAIELLTFDFPLG